MAIDEITNQAITNYSIIGLSAFTIGLMAYGMVTTYRNTKAMNRMFDSASAKYRDDFSKEDLLSFYKDMQLNFRRNMIGKRRRKAEDLCDKLEEQIMRYTAQEMIEYVTRGKALDFDEPVEVASPTYKAAKTISDKSHTPTN